jgi:hypothetical protein
MKQLKKKTAPPSKRGGPVLPKKKKTSRVDEREQLVNAGESGPIAQVSLPLEMITSLRGIMLDVDPQLFRKEVAPFRKDPEKFYSRTLRKMLARHPTLSKAEVRVSGCGLHVILWLCEPVEFLSEAERQRWAAMVKVIQRLLPTDPDCPGITALTRPLGSVNAKRKDAVVRRVREGEPVPAEDVIALFNQARTRPFRTIARLLFGKEQITPCPVCDARGSQLSALDHVGSCYGHRGKVRIGQLFDVFLKPRAIE